MQFNFRNHTKNKMIVLLHRFKWVLHQLFWGRIPKRQYNVPYCTTLWPTLQKYSLGFFCDWCFVTIPSYIVKDPGDEEYKKIYIQFDCFFSICKKNSHFILTTGIKSREKPGNLGTRLKQSTMHNFLLVPASWTLYRWS